MLWLERLAESRIREAMERGEFDSLPLAGKPLPLESNGYVHEDLRLAYKLLKDAGFLPPEIELRKEIVTLKELLDSVSDEDERYRLARQINDKVLRLNLMMKRSFDRADREVYARKVRNKLESP
jgi:hypothetical protein